MHTEIDERHGRPYRPPLYNLRWSAVAAGLVVGITSEVFLLLLGAAIGLALLNMGAAASEQKMLFAASVWNAASMVAASAIGGYIAARASGMRRTGDGILHGVLAWGLAMLAMLLLATSAAGALFAEMLDIGAPEPTFEITRPLNDEERQTVMDILENNLGLTGGQAASIAGQIEVPARRPHPMNGDAMTEARQALRAASMFSGWLSIAILFSLLGAIGGGILGSRSTRRVVNADLRHAATSDAEGGSDNVQ